MPFDVGLVAGQWVEVREEAQPGQILLRPLTADLPPARGRRRLDLDAQGGAREGRPGADDRFSMAPPTSWTLDGALLTIASGEWAGRYKIDEADGTKLVLSRQ